jgi:hypothetical protein
MADLISQRSALNKARADHESGRLDLAVINSRISLLQQELTGLARAADPDNVDNSARRAALEEQIASLSGQAEEAQAVLKGATAQLNQLNEGWLVAASLTDPRVQLNNHFENRTPFLLFPVRMETRFKTVVNPDTGAAGYQLWVRIYPDTCMVDSFDPHLSAQEVRNTARFWTEYYAAGLPADENNPDPHTLELQQAAWAFLVNLEGAGRAAWLVQAEEATPLSGSVFPQRDSNKSLILTIATEDAAILANQAAIFDFFKALWQAGDDEAQKDAIKSGFANADDVIAKYLPINFSDPLPPGLTRAEAEVKIALILLPETIAAAGKTHAWSQAARVVIAPERFVLLGYQGDNLVINELGRPIPSPLQVGFDPNAAKADSFSLTESGDLNIPPELLWIVDFDEAVAKGMGFRVNLDQSTRSGVDRLLCLGVRLSADETQGGGQQLVNELFEHHFYSDKGFSIVPQGTPTNNTEEERSGFMDVDDPAATFERYLKGKPAFASVGDWQDKRDGQWLSEWLGLDEALFQKLLHAERLDQADAINMNLALWPGTFGYAMEAMMSPVFPEEVIETTRHFFSMYVAGRGAVPAVRIASQPYGILPAAAFTRLEWMRPRPATADTDLGAAVHRIGMAQAGSSYIFGLHELLKKIEADWRKLLVPQVSHASAEKPLDTHQHLLDIVGLHPNSAEFYFRYMQTLELLYSYAKLAFPFGDVQQGFDKMEFGSAYQLLLDLGYQPDAEDDLPQLSKLYGLDFNWQHKVIIDTVPLSETEGIRSYTEDGRNYIEALLEAAAKSMDALRKSEGLSEQPTALLFKLLKFALEQGYFETAVRLHQAAEVFTTQQAAAIRTEKPFLHMRWRDEMVESRYALLYREEERVAPNGVSVAQHISSLVAAMNELKVISPLHYQQMAALERLKKASTARLERALVEHLDCASYRLDAWQQGLLKLQLMLMRGNASVDDEDDELPAPRKGLYLGAFGWLENVRPETDKVLTPATVPADLKADFPESYLNDDANAGYIHAPSVNQAVSAAVLRNAFLSNGSADNNSEFAVNLSSERIRLALTVIEGIQNGQSLAALLGYKFERMLHDQKGMKDKKIDTFIYALRKQFPLNADQISETRVTNDPTVDPDTVPITAVEARNVVHGKHLIDHVRKQTGAAQSYPFGLPPKKLPLAEAAVAKAITDAVDHIMNIEDAVADLAMAESVHQVTLGNYDRATGVLESYSTGSYPQTPDVIRTPRSGPTQNHRIGLQMSFVPTVPFDALHPRKSAEPSLNQWLATILPSMDKLVCHVKYSDRTDQTVKRLAVSMQDLQLEPIDLLYLLGSSDATLAAIDEHVLHFIYSSKAPMLDTDIEIEYVPRPADASRFSLFEVMALLRSLRTLLLESAPLKPTDIYRSSEASSKDPVLVTLYRARADNLSTGLNTLLDGTFSSNVRNVLNALPAEPNDVEKEAMQQNVDTYLTNLFSELEKLRRFGLPQSSSGHLYGRRAVIIDALQQKINEVIDRFLENRAEYDDLRAAFDPLAADAVAQLQAMEALLSTQYSELDIISDAIVLGKKTAFDNKLSALQNVLQPAGITGITALLNNVRTATVNIGDFLLDEFSLTEIEAEIVRLVQHELRPFAQNSYDLGKKQITKVTTLLTDLATKGPQAQVDLIQQAVQAILGENFKLVPRYDLDSQQQFEINNAWNSADLLYYLKNVHTPKYLDPVEDWLHGAARVREKMHHAENCLMLREALGLNPAPFSLHPIQLPFKSADYHWLAMPFPEDIVLEDGDVLLYTAVTDAGSGPPTYACGFLLDEWTEVIPTESETTGLTFHYDKPSSEAPQSFLLVLPTRLDGKWQWADLVDALHNTLDSARLRAVEPYQIDQTTYARYLPALLSPTTRHPITIGMYLAHLPLFATMVNQPSA